MIFLGWESEHVNLEPALPPGAARNQKWAGIHIPVAVFHRDAPLLQDLSGIGYLGCYMRKMGLEGWLMVVRRNSDIFID